jgi:uncharacterized membrane protein YgcG
LSLPRRVSSNAATYFALTALLGCAQMPADPLDDEAESRQKTQRIYGGMPSNEDTDAVVLVLTQESQCTGTVVAPRLVLTARHCIAPYVDGTYQCSNEGGYNPTRPRNPPDAGFVGAPFRADTVEIRIGQFPYENEPDAIGEKIYTVPTDTICRNDIALVRVDRELGVPPRAMRLAATTRPGELITAIGYGISFTDVGGRHERSGIEILAVGKSSVYPEGRGAYDRTFRTGQGACPGDSGGPAMGESGAVLGLSSIGVNDCNSDAAQNYYTHLAPYRSFIEDSFADAGFEVPYEPGSEPTTGTGGSLGAAGAATDSQGSGGEGSSAGGSTGSGGSNSGSGGAGGSGGAATDGIYIIPGRRKKDDGCSFGVVGDERSRELWAPLLIALVALRRQSPSKRSPRV